MFSLKRIKLCIISLVCGVLFNGSAEACMVCIPVPEVSSADRLLSAKAVVLARENPNKPFTYIAVEVLKGDLETPEIELFIDSATRRRLAFNPDRSVVLALGRDQMLSPSDILNPRSRGVDRPPGGWRSLGYATAKYEALIREILLRAPQWRSGAGRVERAKFFMGFLAETERSIHDLAYLEVARAPYETIRLADRFVPAEQVQAFLADPQYFEWRPLYILLLGVDAAPGDVTMIRDRIGFSARLNLTANLSAWATALIEAEGHAAIGWLETTFLDAPRRDPAVVLEVVKALSVQGTSRGGSLRERIAETYGKIANAYPSLAGWVARDLTAWRDWRLANALAAIRVGDTKMDGPTAYAIDYYLGQARPNASD